MFSGFDSLPVTHIFFNSVVPFTSDPWLSLVTDSLGLSVSFFYWIILIVGLLIGKRPMSGIIGACVVVAMLGFDSVLLRVFAWLPWIFLGISRFQRTAEISILVLLLFLGMRLTYSAGLLTCVSFLFLASLTLFNSSTPTERSRCTLCLLLVGLGIVFTAHSLPSLPTFDYPMTTQVQASVVPDDGVAGTVPPLLGPAFPMQVIDIHNVQTTLRIPFFILLALAIITARSIGAWILLGVIGIDLFTTANTQLLSPLSALSRMIPGTILYPMVSIAIGILTWWLFISSTRIRAILGIAAVLIGLNFQHLAAFDLTAIQQSWGVTPKQLASPSLAVFTRSAPSTGKLFEWQPCSTRIQSFNHTSKYPIENPPDLMRIITDGDPKTRISLGQAAGNTLELCFHDAPPKALWLEVGDFVTDFPRNFSVLDHATQKKLATFSPWLGPIRWTDELSLPYYGAQRDVQFALGASFGNCIDIRLEADNPTFDWSVTGLRCVWN